MKLKGDCSIASETPAQVSNSYSFYLNERTAFSFTGSDPDALCQEQITYTLLDSSTLDPIDPSVFKI